MTTQSAIRAAGVVLLRDGKGGPEFLAVHRPGRADWSLPKGKLDAGEHLVAAAIRECDEETGFTPVLQVPLETLTYSVLSRPKVVNYWRAKVRTQEEFTPDDEIDEIRWTPAELAAALLTYPSDVRLVTQATGIPDTVPLVILRHTRAMKRSDFDGNDDAERPLTGKGRSQATALVPLLDAFGITEVHASSARRCIDTVKRLGRHLDRPVHPEPALTEEGHHADRWATAARAAELALVPLPLVVCSHRPVLPTILDAIAGAVGLDLEEQLWQRTWDPRLPPGGFIVVHRAFGPDGTVRILGLERHTLGGA
jgi:8-oxo-dGTP pyrophosphatase MutT (NUDIX family)/phosphohistidine phosphatase SixA